MARWQRRARRSHETQSRSWCRRRRGHRASSRLQWLSCNVSRTHDGQRHNSQTSRSSGTSLFVPYKHVSVIGMSNESWRGPCAVLFFLLGFSSEEKNDSLGLSPCRLCVEGEESGEWCLMCTTCAKCVNPGPNGIDKQERV